MTLTDFLLARIAEDEAAAHYSTTRGDAGMEDWGGWWLGHYQHYSRHDPARVLAECEAKRRIVGLEVTMAPADFDQRSGDWEAGQADALGSVLALLALPYADHPDYREEWKP